MPWTLIILGTSMWVRSMLDSQYSEGGEEQASGEERWYTFSHFCGTTEAQHLKMI